MKKEIKAVIGKNFGDEGKGMAVDCLCRGKNAVVVRHNGGAQAGHTVEEGPFRFVFHQLGSGSYRGCPTYWSETFLPDLFKLGEEVESFKKEVLEKTGKILEPVIYAYGDCACTTVYDVLLNSLAEVLRGKEKHGSCGMGIYETVLRSKEKKYTLRLKEFAGASISAIAEKLRLIRDEYVKGRLEKLKKEYPKNMFLSESREWTALLYDENLPYNAAEIMCENFGRYVTLADMDRIWEQYAPIIFEGAQGLMLDENNTEYYPHLTPSRTGLYNVARLIGKYEVSLEVIYVSRTYVTRHGAGRLDFECAKEDINPLMEDKTNLANRWQNDLRFARHPYGDGFWKYIRQDLNYLNETGRPAKVSLYLTHLDETKGKILFSDRECSFGEFTDFCNREDITVYCDSGLSFSLTDIF